MTRYYAYYGSWRDKGGVTQLPVTFSRKECFKAARETANRLGVEVTIIVERPTGHGLAGEHYHIMPED